MPPGGARFDENTVPPWTRGDFRGFWTRQQTHPGAARHPSDGGDFQRNFFDDRCRFAFFPLGKGGIFRGSEEFLEGLQGRAKPVGGNMVSRIKPKWASQWGPSRRLI